MTSDHRPRGVVRRWLRSGSEPLTARSDLRLRALLSGIFAPIFLIGTGVFAWLATSTRETSSTPPQGFFIAMAVVCGVFLLITLADLAVIRRRLAEARRWGR